MNWNDEMLYEFDGADDKEVAEQEFPDDSLPGTEEDRDDDDEDDDDDIIEEDEDDDTDDDEDEDSSEGDEE